MKSNVTKKALNPAFKRFQTLPQVLANKPPDAVPALRAALLDGVERRLLPAGLTRPSALPLNS
jgi:hypothetical protein